MKIKISTTDGKSLTVASDEASVKVIVYSIEAGKNLNFTVNGCDYYIPYHAIASVEINRA